MAAVYGVSGADSTCNAISRRGAASVCKRLDERLGIVIHRPEEYQGRRDGVLNAMFDFEEMTDRAVLTAGGAPFAVAVGKMRVA